MPSKAVYDTRFFIEYFYSDNQQNLKKLSENLRHVKEHIIATVTIYELYRIILSREGREVAKHRITVINRDFKVEDLTWEIAVKAAELNHNTGNPMTDSIIAAIAQEQKAPVVSDDPHFNKINNLKIVWPIKLK